MKKLLILLNFIVFFINASAQLAPVGTKWVYETMSYDIPRYYYSKFEATIIRDTIIDSTTYSVINSYFNNKFYYTKENNKIFYNKNGEKLLFFDFDIKKGDTLLVDYSVENYLIKKHPIYIKNIFYIKDTINNDSLKAVICIANRIHPSEGIAEILIVEKILTHYHGYNNNYGYYQSLRSYPFNSDLLGLQTFESSIGFKCYTEPNGYNFKTVNDCSKVGLKNIEQTFFEIYPNPVSDFLYLKNAKLPIENISIYNILGVMIYSKSYSESAIDLQNFPSGVYFIEVKSNNEFYRQKIIKE
jgi:hypothetical protein